MPVTDADIAKRIGVKVGAVVPVSLYQAGVNANSRQEMSEFDLRRTAAEGDPVAGKAVTAMDNERARMARESRDPLADIARQTLMDQKKQADLDAIGNWKLQEEKNIVQHRDTALSQLSGTGKTVDVEAETKRINAETQSQLQDVQNQFANKARARGLQPDDYDVSIDSSGINYKLRPPVIPAAPAARPAVTPTAAPPAPVAARPAAPVIAPPASAAQPAAPPRPVAPPAVAPTPTAAAPSATPAPSADTYTDPVSKKTYTVGQTVNIGGSPVRITEIRNGVPHGLPIYKIGDMVTLPDGKHRVNAVDPNGNPLSVDRQPLK